jgi:hypothetical protein
VALRVKRGQVLGLRLRQAKRALGVDQAQLASAGEMREVEAAWEALK